MPRIVLAALLALSLGAGLAAQSPRTGPTKSGLLAQWLFRETPGFRAGKFWSALLTLGIVMVGLRWLIHR